MIKIQLGIQVRLKIGIIHRKRPAFRPSRPKTKIRRPRSCYHASGVYGNPGGVDSLSNSEDVSFDEDSVGKSNRLRAEGWNFRINGEMLTWISR